MAEKEDKKNYFVDEKSKSQRLLEFVTKLLDAFFDVFYLQYKESNLQVHLFSRKRERLYHGFNMIVYTLQLTSLVFPPATPDWDSFSVVSDVVGAARVDYILVKLNLGMPFYFIGLSITLITFLSLALVFIKSLKKMKYDIKNYKLTLTAGLAFIKNVSFIPFLCIFVAVQKYDATGVISEYGNNSIALPVPYLGSISVIFGLILIFLAFVENTFQYQQFFIQRNTSVFSRAHSKIESLKIFLSVGLVYSHFYLSDNQNTIHLAYAIAIGSLLWSLYTYYLPFYQDFTNFTHSSAYLLLFWNSFVQLFCYLVPNSSVVFVLIVFVAPCLLIMQWDLLKRRKLYIKTEYDRSVLELDTIYKCELLVRSYSQELIKCIKSGSSKAEKIKNDIFMVFRYMKKKFKFSNIQSAWEAIFVLTILKDEGLARVKLLGTYTVFDIEGSYLYYKYSKIMDDFSNTYLEEVDFVKFRQLYEHAIKQDKKTCQLQFEFWKELSSEKPNVSNLETIAYRLRDSLVKCKKNLKKLIQNYPNNQLALKLFGTFLLEVYNDTIKGNDFLSKAEHERQQQEMKSISNYEKFNYFDENNGIIIVSGTEGEIGNIKSVNQQACDILKIPLNLAITLHISNFLLPPLSSARLCNRVLIKFLMTAQSTVFDFPFLNYFIDTFEFLVEIYIQIRCVSLNSQPYFLGVLKKSNLPRESIIYDSDTILASTRGFSKLIGFSDNEISLKGYQISLVIQKFEIFLKNKQNNEVFQYMIPHTINYISMKFTEIIFKEYVFKILIASDDKNEISQWNVSKEVNNFNEIIDLKANSTGSEIKMLLSKGILKSKFSPKKSLSVKFNIEPTIFIIGETDFKPGKSVSGKVKDAIPKTPVKLEKHAEDAIPIESDKSQSDNKNVEFMDLKDLELSTLRKAELENDDASENPDNIKKSGASVASSAQSSNASFTSSSEAQSLLTGVTSSMKSFKIAFFMTILIVNIAVISMIIYLKIVSTNYIDTFIVQELSKRRSLMCNITLFARDLQLINYKLENYDEHVIRKFLYNDILLYQNIVALIESKISYWDQVVQNFYTSQTFPVWDLVGGQIEKSELNLMNIMKNFISRSYSLYQTPLSNITYLNADLYYIYRNGIGESFEAINSSMQIFQAQEELSTNSIQIIILLLALAAITLMVICFFSVIIPTLFSMEKSNGTVWRLFYLLPLDLVQEMKSRCDERLEMTHGVEPEPSDDFHKFKNLKNRKSIKMKRKWDLVLIKISLYYILSTGFFMFFYYYAYLDFAQLLKLKPLLVNTSGLGIYSTNSIFFWLQELKYENSSLSYMNETDKYRSISSPKLKISDYLNLLHFSEFSLVYGDLSGQGMTSLHQSYLLDSCCFSPNCLILKKGVHSGVLMYSNDVLNIQKAILASKNPNLTSILNKKNELIYGQKILKDLYNQDVTNAIQSNINTIIIVTTIYCLLVTFLYFVIYIPVINSVKEEITKVWKLGRLIPIEHRSKIMTAFKQASGKIKKF